MKKIGKVIKFNGSFGTIMNENNKIYFSNKDLDSKDISIDDVVEYREEIRDLDLHLARNIKVLDKNNYEK